LELRQRPKKKGENVMGRIARKPKSLVTKLAEACNSVGGVEKKGRNEFQKYAYVRAADISKVFRRELFKRNILLTSNELDLTEKEVPTNSGGTMRYVTLKAEYILRDGESGETLTSVAYGMGMDSGDKAVWKAKTGALKYFLRGLGIVPDERDDPEADESVDEQTDHRVMAEFDKKTAKQRTVAEYQIRAFDSACHDSGKTADQVAVFLREKYKVATVADLQRGDFNEAIKWAVKNGDLIDTLAVSASAASRKKAERVMIPDPEQSQAGD
jgi:ERF superfamily